MSSPGVDVEETDKKAIEALHKLDVQATLSGRADILAGLWDERAVRIPHRGPADIGRQAIYASDKQQEEASRGWSVRTYEPEIREVRVTDGWGFEWGYFDLAIVESSSAVRVDLRGKLLRVLKRQSDGSWKFVAVMVDFEEGEPAAEGQVAGRDPARVAIPSLTRIY